MNAPTVSVIVCAYTEERWLDLQECLNALYGQTKQPDEIIVVIDHNDALYHKASEQLIQPTVIKNWQKRGLSGARNSGIAIAKGEIIAFIDEDAMAEPDWLAQLCAHYDDQTVMAVGGKITPFWQSGKPDWFPEEFNWVVGCTYLGMPETVAPVRNLIGCNMSFRRDIFHAIGGFRDGIGRVGTRPVGCEETELCIRARQFWSAGHILYDPNAEVFHRVPEWRTTWAYFRSRCYSEGLSKALVTRLVGAQDGLANERSYTMRTLPLGVVRGLKEGITQGRPSSAKRSWAICLGLATTVAGYLIGKFKGTSKNERTPLILFSGG